MSTQKHPIAEPGGTAPSSTASGGTEPGAPAKNTANTAASPSTNAGTNTAESSLNRRILALAVPAFGALIAEPIFVLTDSALIGQLGKA